MVERRQNWRRAEEELEEVNRRSNGGGSLLPHWRCLFFPIAETKTGLNLQLNPWPAFDLVNGTGGGGQRAGRRGGSWCEMGACCCFEVPPRIWKRPIKQDYKSGTTFLLNLSIHPFIPRKNWGKHRFTNILCFKKLSESNGWDKELNFCWWQMWQRAVSCW